MVLSSPVPDFMAHSLRRLPVPTSKNMWSTASICESSRLESVPNFEALNIKNSRWWIGSMELPYFLANQCKSGESAGKTMIIKLDAAWAKNVRCRVETRHRGLSQIQFKHHLFILFQGNKICSHYFRRCWRIKKRLTLKPRPSQRGNVSAPLRLRPVAHTFEIAIAAGKP